jgi:hypothetical protein
MSQFNKGNLVNQVITKSDPSFKLEGMICPTFQNMGTSNVLFNGLTLLPGESYAVNVPTVVLTNSVDIQFESTTGRKLVVSYVRLNEAI